MLFYCEKWYWNIFNRVANVSAERRFPTDVWNWSADYWLEQSISNATHDLFLYLPANAISIPTLIFPIFTIIFTSKFLLFQYLHWYFGTDMLLLPNALISCGNIFKDRLLSSNFKYSSVIIENEKLQRVKLRTFHFQP